MTLASNGLQNAVVYRWTYADATARTSATGFVSTDVGALALQQSDNTLWMLTATTPTWIQALGAGGSLTVDEVDGTPSVSNVTHLTVSNGTLTDNTGGHVTITVGGGSVAYPTHAARFADELVLKAGVTLSYNYSSGYAYSFYANQASAALNDYFETDLLLAAGTYTLSLQCAESTDRGIITWTLDGGSSLGTMDLYNGSLVLNAIKTLSISVGSDGAHTLRGTVSSKNASSSGYAWSINKLWLRQ